MPMSVCHAMRSARCPGAPASATVALATLLALVVAGCTTPTAPTTVPVPAAVSGARPMAAVSVTGTATYRERMALPPDAVLEAVIEDSSKAGAPAIILGRTEVTSIQVPVSFSIPYDPAKLDPRARYSVRTRILVEGRPWFTSDTFHPVLRDAGDTRVDIVMRRVAAAP